MFSVLREILSFVDLVAACYLFFEFSLNAVDCGSGIFSKLWFL